MAGCYQQVFNVYVGMDVAEGVMLASFCVDCLEEALRHYGKPEIFNSDQGSQFTSADFTGVLKREKIKISMDGRGRAFDNIFVERLFPLRKQLLFL